MPFIRNMYYNKTLCIIQKKLKNTILIKYWIILVMSKISPETQTDFHPDNNKSTPEALKNLPPKHDEDESSPYCYTCCETNRIFKSPCKCTSLYVCSDCFEKLRKNKKCTACNSIFVTSNDCVIDIKGEKIKLNETITNNTENNHSQSSNSQQRFHCSFNCDVGICCIIIFLTCIVSLMSLLLGSFMAEAIHKDNDVDSHNIGYSFLYGFSLIFGVFLFIFLCIICCCPRIGTGRIHIT